jgi:hypothetical protein
MSVSHRRKLSTSGAPDDRMPTIMSMLNSSTVAQRWQELQNALGMHSTR